MRLDCVIGSAALSFLQWLKPCVIHVNPMLAEATTTVRRGCLVRTWLGGTRCRASDPDGQVTNRGQAIGVFEHASPLLPAWYARPPGEALRVVPPKGFITHKGAEAENFSALVQISGRKTAVIPTGPRLTSTWARQAPLGAREETGEKVQNWANLVTDRASLE